MLRYLLSRLLTFLPTFFGVTIISFSFIRLLPGDPIMVMAGERGVSPERYQELVQQFGFDRPLYVQYFDYLGGVLQGNLGQSFVTKKPVWNEFFALFPATLELSLCAMIFAVALGLPAGVIAAVNRGKFFDRTLMSTALVGYSMP
ncbi:MAG: peptide ABC transporter permease, partial [Rhodobacteraceae bacterium]|nr:peptide ABC transporter permease [Paracoccaceae bacterium]